MSLEIVFLFVVLALSVGPTLFGWILLSFRSSVHKELPAAKTPENVKAQTERTKEEKEASEQYLTISHFFWLMTMLPGSMNHADWSAWHTNCLNGGNDDGKWTGN